MLHSTVARLRHIAGRHPVSLAILFLPALALPMWTLPASAHAQAPEPPPFTDRIDVEVVNLEVFVTDRKGNPVSGLGPEDFQVLEDGEIVEITNFRDASASGTVRPSDGAAGAADAAVPAPQSASQKATVDPLLVTLFIDRTTTDPAHLIRVEEDLTEFLERQTAASPGVRFALALADPQVRFATEVTNDPQQLVTAIRELGKPQIQGLSKRVRRSQVFNEIQTDWEACEMMGRSTGLNGGGCEPCHDRFEAFMAYARQYTNHAEAEAGHANGLLGEVVGALGGVPGAKALVYVSDGTEQRPGLDVFHFLGELCPERDRETRRMLLEFDETAALHRLSAFANANRVTLYPLDVGGVRASSATDASTSRRLFMPSADNDTIRTLNVQNSLQVLASETGGQAIFNQNRPLEKLLDLASDFTAYYSIGYRPPESQRRTRLLRVHLTNPKKGWDVRYRRSYVSKTQEERLAERLMATLLLGQVENPLGADISFEPIGGQTDEATPHLPVVIRARSSAFTSIPGPDGPTRSALIFLVAQNDAGERTRVRKERIVVPEGDDEILTLVVRMQLGPGDWEVAAGVQDEPSSTTSYLRGTAEVAENADDAQSG